MNRKRFLQILAAIPFSSAFLKIEAKESEPFDCGLYELVSDEVACQFNGPPYIRLMFENIEVNKKDGLDRYIVTTKLGSLQENGFIATTLTDDPYRIYALEEGIKVEKHGISCDFGFDEFTQDLALFL